MKKKTSSLPTTAQVQQPQAAPDTRAFGRTFLIKDNILTPEPELPDEIDPVQKPFKSLHELDRLVMLNREPLFGDQTLGLGAKAEGLSFPWDAFLFDFSDSAKPRCFLLKVALSSEPFDKFLLSMTEAFAYLRNADNRLKMIETLTANVQRDKKLLKVFLGYIGKEKPFVEFFSETIFKRCKVLLLTDGNRPSLQILVEAYTETWGMLLSIIYLQKYQVGKAQVLSMHPTLADLVEKPKEKPPKAERVIHTEDHHFLKGSSVVRDIYEKLKSEAFKIDKSLVVNPRGKHYISLRREGSKNLCFFHFRKTSIYLVVMIAEKEVRKLVKKAEIKSLPMSVQSFWNGASTGLVISSMDQLKEVGEVLKKLIKQ